MESGIFLTKKYYEFPDSKCCYKDLFIFYYFLNFCHYKTQEKWSLDWS